MLTRWPPRDLSSAAQSVLAGAEKRASSGKSAGGLLGGLRLSPPTLSLSFSSEYALGRLAMNGGVSWGLSASEGLATSAGDLAE